jgi:hypothetical protein
LPNSMNYFPDAIADHRSRLNLAPYCQSFRANFPAKWFISLS